MGGTLAGQLPVRVQALQGRPTNRIPTRSLRSDATHAVRTSASGSRNQSSRGPGTTDSSTTLPGMAATGAWSNSGIPRVLADREPIPGP